MIDILCIRDWPPVDDPSLDEDSDLDLYRGGGVRGETQGHGGIVVHHIQRTEIHGAFVAAVNNPAIYCVS